MFKDKSITANNIYILEDIFKRQLRLDDESPIFNTNIRLVYSNLEKKALALISKTIARLLNPFEKILNDETDSDNRRTGLRAPNYPR